MVIINTNELYEKTLSLIENGKIKQALMITRKLLKSEPNNIAIKMQYAKLLTYDEKTKLRGIDLMMKIYHSDLRHKSLIELGKQSKILGDYEMARYFFTELIKSDKLSSIYGILELINLNMLENKFEEAYYLLKKYYNRLIMVSDKNTIINTDFHIRYKLGLIDEDEPKVNYYKRNLVYYDKNDVIIHIKRHSSSSDRKKIHTQFKENVDITNLYNSIKERINYVNPSYSTSVDVYEIDYGDIIGYVDGEETNCLEVVTYINSKNILTIYPISKEIIHKQKIKKI